MNTYKNNCGHARTPIESEGAVKTLTSRLKKNRMQLVCGFTVIEFLVVIGIMAILLGIALAGINLSRERARDDGRISDMQTISIALEQFRDVCREYPHTLSLQDALGQPGTCDYTLGDFLQGDMNLDEISYYSVAIDRTGTPVDGRCVGYHMGVKLETDHSALQSDADFDSRSLHNDYKACDLSNQSFDAGQNMEPDNDDMYYYDVTEGVSDTGL